MFIVNFLIVSVLIVIALIASTQGQQKCRTPSGPIGQCVEFNSCELLNKSKDEDLIAKSSCGRFNGVPMTCCPNKTMKKLSKRPPITRLEPRNPFTDFSTHPNAKLIPLNKCGGAIDDKISQGETTEPFEFPWMVILRTYQDENEPTEHCGGTLISNRYVLTAAHCLRLTQGEIRIHSVVIGEHNTKTDPDCIEGDECADPVQIIPVAKTIPHPKFSTANIQNDIGLVRLKRNVKFSFSVRPICIPYTSESQVNHYSKIIVTGWGITEIGSTSNVLMKATLNVISNDECSTMYQRYYADRYKITENFMCALDGLQDTCKGDSGGPATFIVPITSMGSRMFQYGIISGGARLCGKNMGIPGVYTRVTSYVEWILDNISE